LVHNLAIFQNRAHGKRSAFRSETPAGSGHPTARR
jgi:hypothetical protein